MENSPPTVASSAQRPKLTAKHNDNRILMDTRNVNGLITPPNSQSQEDVSKMLISPPPEEVLRSAVIRVSRWSFGWSCMCVVFIVGRVITNRRVRRSHLVYSHLPLVLLLSTPNGNDQVSFNQHLWIQPARQLELLQTRNNNQKPLQTLNHANNPNDTHAHNRNSLSTIRPLGHAL
jgi:hypothetical protein